MSQFLYFFPGAPGHVPDRERVRSSFAATALRDLLRSDKTWNGSFIVNGCTNGPGGHSGTVIVPKIDGQFPEGFTPAFVKDTQQWVNIDDAWLGWFPDVPPTEQSLRKSSMVSGYPVRLNDDCEWMAPTIRCQPVGSRVTLPRMVTRDSSGKRVYRIKKEYERFQEIAELLWNYHFAGAVIESDDELLDMAAELLSLNYRIGPAELDALGLFDMVGSDSNWLEIMGASFDWPLIKEFLEAEEIKKKALVLSEQSAGNAGETKPDAA